VPYPGAVHSDLEALVFVLVDAGVAIGAAELAAVLARGSTRTKVEELLDELVGRGLVVTIYEQ
jgi:hypothetical protein